MLLNRKKNQFSQNGEDGIIQYIFHRIGTTSKKCCEFGAWDGKKFSNTRQLIISGWKGLLIEADAKKFARLKENYHGNRKVVCLHRRVDAKKNRISLICKRSSFLDLDFLSIDIDGLDYEIFETLNFKPRVICIEVNAGHNPEDLQKIPRYIAKNNVGQPLGWFTSLAQKKNYYLICYTGNAFYLRGDIINTGLFPALSPKEAYEQFLSHLNQSEREWCFLAGLSLVEPYFPFNNQFLTRKRLKIDFFQGIFLILGLRPTYSLTKNPFRRIKALEKYLF